MNNIIKYFTLCLGAILCTTSLTSCPAGKAAATAGRSSRAYGKAAKTATAGPSKRSYGETVQSAVSTYIDYNNSQKKNNYYHHNNNYSYGYTGGNSYGGYRR